ncbi:hypothetical protein D3C78_1869870 [compost metagenome]
MAPIKRQASIHNRMVIFPVNVVPKKITINAPIINIQTEKRFRMPLPLGLARPFFLFDPGDSTES